MAKKHKFEPVQLGDRVKDPITGYTGIAVAITTWLNGCIRIGVQPEKLDKQGKIEDALNFDQSQLVMVKKGVHKPLILGLQQAPAPEPKRTSGGPAREGATFKRF